MKEIEFRRILVAIETDPTRYHGEHPARPRLPGKSGAEQMLSHLSTDLAGQFGEIKSFALCMAGALFDQTELLRPGFPVFGALEEILAASFQGQEFQPRLLSLGADDGRLPRPELQPSEQVPLGVLLTLPLVVGGGPKGIESLGQAMEHRFMESGQLSAHSARALEAQFGIAVNHARFMTVTDLNAMLRLQLEHFGFLPLWQLLDTAINQPEETLAVEGRGGQQFKWDGRSVVAQFETFDQWATTGNGKALPAGDQALAESYADWTREYRQFLTTLQAHGITVQQVLSEDMEISGDASYAVETVSPHGMTDAAQVTEHSAGELGTIAVSLNSESSQRNYYPLEPRGLNRLHADVRAISDGTQSVAFPGTILYDPGERRLCPETLRGEK